MSPEFDSYHKWLGIPPAEQPPHHYRLLGLAVFEHDLDVIEIASDQRMALLRSFHTGPHSDLSQKLLNEVAAARLCLLRPDRRQRYDEGLRQRLATAGTQAAPAAKPAPTAPAPAPAKTTPAAAAPIRSEFDLLDDLPGSSKPTPAPSPAKGPAGAGLSGIGKRGPTSPGQSGIDKNAPAKNDSVELLGKVAKRAKSDEIELVGKSAKEPEGVMLQLVGKAAKKSREIELSPRSSAWDQAIADACSTQSVVHRRRRRWHIDTRVIQFMLFIAFVAGLGYAGSVGYQMWQDYEFKQSNKVAKSKSTPPPPTTATTTTNTQPATTSTDSTDETDVRPAPVGRQPAFGGGRSFAQEPNPADTNPPPNDTASNIPRDPSRSTQPGPNGYYQPQTARSPVPGSEEQKRAIQEINDVFKDQIRQAVGLVNQRELAKRFARVAADTKDPVMRYVLANQALEIAVRLGDVEVASLVVGGLAANYEINGWELKYRTLTQLARSQRSPRREVAVAAFGMVEEALADGHFDNAQELATLSLNLSAKDPVLHEQARLLVERVKFVQKQTKAVEEANSRLAADPEDRSAQLVVGKFQCFVKQDWDGGLAHLAKGADDILRTLAERDQRQPAQAEQQLQLADAWWTLADQRMDPKNEIESKGLRSRAVFWYRKAMPGLSGFPLEKARGRSADAP